MKKTSKVENMEKEFVKSLQQTIARLTEQLKLVTEERDKLSTERDDMKRLAETRKLELEKGNAKIRALMEQVKYSDWMENRFNFNEDKKEDLKFKRKIVKTFFIPCEKCPLFAKSLRKHKIIHYKEYHLAYYKEIRKYERYRVKLSPSNQQTNCDICKKKMMVTSIKLHKKQSHGMDLNNVPLVENIKEKKTCKICGHVSKYVRDLKTHMKIVHERKLDYPCKYCNKKFCNRGNLNKHELIHTGGTPYQCDVCGKQFRWKNLLVKHIGSHTQSDTSGVVSKWDYIITPDTEIHSNVEINDTDNSPLLQYLALQNDTDIMAQTDIVSLLSNGLF